MLTFLILLWLQQRKNAKRSKRHHRRYKTRPVFRNRGVLGEMTLICEVYQKDEQLHMFSNENETVRLPFICDFS